MSVKIKLRWLWNYIYLSDCRLILQYSYLTVVAGYESSLLDFAQYDPFYLPLNLSLFPKDVLFCIILTLGILNPSQNCITRQYCAEYAASIRNC